MIKFSKDSNKDLATFVSTYTLALHAQYPIQLIQTVEGLRPLLYRSHRNPGQLNMSGDSDDDNLVIGVPFHLTHRNPAISKLES
jgi:hypothetical protein